MPGKSGKKTAEIGRFERSVEAIDKVRPLQVTVFVT